jgi:polyphosphate kinase
MFSVITGIGKHAKNIEARGIVDSYLEHSRVLVFQNSGNPRYFLSSADFLPRNFDNRFEIICPIYDRKLQNELSRYLELQWADNQKSRELDRDLSNKAAGGREKSQPVRCQEAIYEWLAGLSKKKK